MKGWLARSAASAVRRGRRVGGLGGARSFPRFSAVDPARFQGPDEPYPGHWRRPPEPWPTDAAAPPRVSDALRTLPDGWRAVLWTHDAEHRSTDQTAGELALTAEQERTILGRARTSVRERLAEHLAERDRP